MPGLQRRIGIRDAVHRQPDALQPDDDHELQATACQRGQKAAEVTGRERANL